MTTDDVQTLQSLGIAPYLSSGSRDLRLDLNYRNIQRLPFDLFKFDDLQWLNLNVNKLSELPPEFGTLKHLKWLYLESNLFERFPDVLCELTELIRLYLSSNTLKIIPRDICKLTKLKWLDLSDNMFWEFPLGLCDTSMSNLERLVLDGNKLTCIPAQISILKGMKVLHLKENHIEWLPQSICDLEKLEELQVSKNPLRTFPAYFSIRLKRLRVLECKGCPLIEPLGAAAGKNVRSLREYQQNANKRMESLDMVHFKPQNDGTWDKPCYRMRTRPRGVAVIIDNMCAEGTTGTYRDGDGEMSDGFRTSCSSTSTTGHSSSGN